jgi:hypothetical protein
VAEVEVVALQSITSKITSIELSYREDSQHSAKPPDGSRISPGQEILADLAVGSTRCINGHTRMEILRCSFDECIANEVFHLSMKEA